MTKVKGEPRKEVEEILVFMAPRKYWRITEIRFWKIILATNIC